MTLKASGSVDELSSRVINNIPLDNEIFGTFFGTNLPVEFLSFIFLFYVLMYCGCTIGCIIFIQHIYL